MTNSQKDPLRELPHKRRSVQARISIEMIRPRGSDFAFVMIYLGSMVALFIVGGFVRPVDALTYDKLNLYYKNDFHTCHSAASNLSFTLTDDGTCKLLFPANETLGIGACYYQSYTDDTVRKLAVIGRCDCEYVTNTVGHRAYNRSCNLFRMRSTDCVDLSGIRKAKVFSHFFGISKPAWIRYIGAETTP